MIHVNMQTLKQFQNKVSENLYTTDKGFQKQLKYVVGEKEAARLGEVLNNWEKNLPAWNLLADEAARPEKLPRIEKYDRVGNRVEKIVLPMETRTIRRQVVEKGLWTSPTEVEKFSKIYLLAQLGESGVTCPLACTDGLIRVLKALAPDFVKKKYLPLLESEQFPLAGAQFITEQNGGSDVGAIEGRAVQNTDGTWGVFAEKWYCSATDEFFLVLARPEGAPAGTEGLAIFFIPRVIESEGKLVPNSLSIKRLKDKLGTQSLPTAEIDFEGSKAFLIGKKEEGFHNLMNYILNVSRVHNAANSLAIHRRAFAEARNYAAQRMAFGNTLDQFPLIQETLVSILTKLESRRLLSIKLWKLLDENGFLPEDNEQRFWQRFLINLLKYRTAFELTENVKEAIIVLGANGIIQDFSILPRILRDSLIVETWEGPHNILCLQIMRDSARFDFWGRLFKEVKGYLESWPKTQAPQTRTLYEKALSQLQERVGGLKREDIPALARKIVDRVSDLLEVGELMTQGQIFQASWLAFKMWGDPLEFDNPARKILPQVALDLIEEKEVKIDPKNL
ncbi:MAG TPA: hypothetical protein DDW49_10965 [Deltaproteobacteria bacterium]|nr:MAG: hypothetical protein A2048_01920 [Deltaproteobacteria bacterium GWA2_45_12]HBF13885.1 hypothetical protein [Deltaproteobacteria bacterium]